MRKTVLAMLLTGASLLTQAQAVDLMQVYRQALENDAVLASARASLAAGEEIIVQGRAGLLPTANLSAGRTQTERNDNHSYGNQYNLRLTQPLFDLASWENYQISKLRTETSIVEFTQAQQDLILRVSQAYFNVLIAADELASIQSQKEATSEQLAFAKRNFEVGTATITDTHEAQARYDLIIAQELAAQNNLAIARTALQQITGTPVDKLAELRTNVELRGPQPEQIDPWVDGAQSGNYAVVARELALEIARRDIRLNRAGHSPTVGVVATHSYSKLNQTGFDVGAGSGSGTRNSIGVELNIPLFSGFAVNSRVNEAIALQNKARADLDDARRTAAQAARQAYFSVTSGLSQIKALEAAEASSRSALEANQLGYQVGVRINIDVLNAQQQLFVARRDLSRARYETLLNSLRLKAAAGTLNETDVQNINDLLEYRAVANTR